MFEIRRYTPADADAWNAYVATSKNGTFLFNRSYMDYHADRFTDHSLMFYTDGCLHSLLPAHIDGSTLYSHLGLTYGGLITNMHTTAVSVIQLFRELNEWLRHAGITRVVYKPVPWIYHQQPAEEDLYPLFWICNAKVTARIIASVYFMQKHLRWRKGRRDQLHRALRCGIEVVRENNFRTFWPILENNLENRFGAHPVHTLEEMELLHSRFPDNIILYNAYMEGRPVAGYVFYLTGQVLRGQYCSATPEGKHLGAMDAIYDKALFHDFTDVQYVDFGGSTTHNGAILNEGLIAQKEGFSARAVCYDTYEWEV